MALRIPKRQAPTRLTLGDVFARLISEVLKPDAGLDLPAAVHFAAVRVHMRAPLTEAQASTALPEVTFLTLDPLSIVEGIQTGIIERELSVEGLPDWIKEVWIQVPFVEDWNTGAVRIREGFRSQVFYPTLNWIEVDRLFHSEPAKDAVGAPRTGPAPTKREAIKARILAALRAGQEIDDRDHEFITAQYGGGAARGTCVAALREALSEFHRENSDKS